MVDDFVVVGKADTAVKLTEEELAEREGGNYWEDVLEEEEEEEEYLDDESEFLKRGGGEKGGGGQKEQGRAVCGVGMQGEEEEGWKEGSESSG